MATYWAKPWSIAQESDLARFVPPNPPIALPQAVVEHLDLSERVKLVYEAFRGLNLEYGLEPWSNPRRAQQLIRHPEQVRRDKVGTCVDLTLFFCAGCREARLLPWIVVLDGHVLAMVSLAYDLTGYEKNAGSRLGDRELFKTGPCRDASAVWQRLTQGRFVAVECTGFARYLGDDPIAARDRDSTGYLSFPAARDAGKHILEEAVGGSPAFRAAIDLGVALETNQQEPEAMVQTEPPRWRRRAVNQALEKSLRDRPIMHMRTPGLELTVAVEAVTPPTTPDAPPQRLDDANVLEWIEHRDVRLAILCGPSGSGKSGFVQRMIESIDVEDVCWVVLNLKEFSSARDNGILEPLIGPAPPEMRVDALGLLSAAPLDAESRLRDLAAGGKLMLLIDGLNEVPQEETRRTILNSVKWLLNQYPTARCLISTRVLPTSWCEGWDGVPRVSGRLASLTILDGALLDRPFFKDRILDDHRRGRRAPATTLLEEYLTEKAHFTKLDLDVMSRAAYRMYVPDRALSFSEAKIVDALKLDAPANFDARNLWGRMTGVDDPIVRSGRSGTAPNWSFEHQTWQDFLTARYLANVSRDENPWASEVFDAVTLQAASTEVLTMTLEQLSNGVDCDAFLERVYNWNWRHAFTCLSAGLVERKQSDPRWSGDIETALTVLLKDKCVDPVFKTRRDAQRTWDALSKLSGRRLPVELRTDAGTRVVGSTSGWYERWYRLREQERFAGPVDEWCVAMILDSHSVVGWTAANVLRRIGLESREALPPGAHKFLRGIFDSCHRSKDDDTAIRWRVVCALGAFPTGENSELLLRALANDRENGWVRFGSARSIVENAVLTTDPDQRRQLVRRIDEACGAGGATPPPDWILAEIGEASLYSDADAHWAGCVRPLLESLRDRCSAERGPFWQDLLTLLNDEAQWRSPGEAPKPK